MESPYHKTLSLTEMLLELTSIPQTSLTTASTPAGLHERRITHIVSVCNEPIPAHHPRSGYIIHKIPVEDQPTEDILIHLPAACQFIHNAMMTEGAVVLVHCVQGLSRSACVVAAYRAFPVFLKSPFYQQYTYGFPSDVVQTCICDGCTDGSPPR